MNTLRFMRFIALLTIVFTALKLTRLIDWSWWWILSPIWLTTTLVVLLLVIFAIVEVRDEEKEAQRIERNRNL